MFKGPRGLLFTLLGAGLVIAAAIAFGFQGQKDDAETSRTFLTHMAAGESEEAYALLHRSVTERTTRVELEAILNGIDAYTQINFPSFSFSTTNGTRQSELSGTATTDSGCSSEITFELLNGQITFFDIQPLCRVTGGVTDA